MVFQYLFFTPQPYLGGLHRTACSATCHPELSHDYKSLPETAMAVKIIPAAWSYFVES
jgi:hypothetical protein